MNTKHIKLAIAMVLIFLTVNVTAQEAITIPLTNPDAPGFLKMRVINGSIIIKGYSGKEVIVKGARRMPSDKIDGVKENSNNSMEFRVEEYENEVNVRNSSSEIMDFEVQVPKNFSLKITTYDKGEIYIENVSGTMDINNTNGKITLKDISGSVIANAMNGDIITNFLKVTPNEPMAFSCMNGNIDITFPESIKADIKIKLEGGEIFSDFEWKIKSSKIEAEKENTRKKGSQYVIKAKKSMTNSINGGGTEIQFKGYNTDIFIRNKLN